MDDLKEVVSFILSLALIVFLCRACSSEKGVIKYSIDTLYEYYQYADSVFNP